MQQIEMLLVVNLKDDSFSSKGTWVNQKRLTTGNDLHFKTMLGLELRILTVEIQLYHNKNLLTFTPFFSDPTKIRFVWEFLREMSLFISDVSTISTKKNGFNGSTTKGDHNPPGLLHWREGQIEGIRKGQRFGIINYLVP